MSLTSSLHIEYTATVHRITELERILCKHKKSCLWKKIVKLIYFDCLVAIRVHYQSLKTRNIKI